ncbi:MAG TPA: SMC family ATPase [Gemmatimonadaceae bacterium]|nr:SMC family ATPase [Gemmatimonadaceae bacterium]
MRLNSLQMVNFRQHVDSRIAFDLGLTAIIGPNGAGKSTILEAIAWAIYGPSAARGTRDTIRFRRAAGKAPVRVELDFELGRHRYHVVRGLTNAELYIDGQPVANSINGVTDMLQRRLGMTQREFFNTYFTGQKELSVMAAMQPAERARFLSQVLGYERLRTAQDLVRSTRAQIVKQVEGVRMGMPDAEAIERTLRDAEGRVAAATARAADASHAQATATASLAAVGPRWEAAQRERERWTELAGELRVAEGEEAALGRDEERLRRELGDVANARADLERLSRDLKPLDEVAEEFQRLETLAREEGRRQALSETARALDEELGRLRERLARIEAAPAREREFAAELETRRKALEEAQAALEARHTEWVRDRQEAETKRQALRQQYAELRDQRDRLVAAGEQGTCPTCARPLGGHYSQVLELLDGQIETARVDGTYFRNRLDQLEQMPEEVRVLDDRRRVVFQEVGALERRLTKVQLAVQELGQLQRDLASKEQRRESLRRDLEAIPPGYDAARHQELRREIDRLTPLNAKAARLSAQIEREPQLQRDRERVGQQRQAAQARLEVLRSKREALRVSEADYGRLRAEHEGAVAALRAADLAAVGAEAEVRTASELRERALEARRALAKVQEKLDALLRDKRLHDELDRAYSDIRTDLNLQLRPEISELASAFLTELTDARYSELELDDQYRLTVLEDGVPKPVISGGEEDLTNLVFRLAISQMIAERAGQSFSLLVLDEVFGSLDESRRHNVVELLRRLRDRFEQVILITHIESVREGVDRVITVRYDEQSGAAVVDGGDLDGTLADDQPALAVGAGGA